MWQDNTAVNYSNWGPPGLGPSMLSHNSCYWIQSTNGLWRPGACANVTMGVVCKLPRGEPALSPVPTTCRPKGQGQWSLGTCWGCGVGMGGRRPPSREQLGHPAPWEGVVLGLSFLKSAHKEGFGGVEGAPRGSSPCRSS